jgi:hypothetical protein
MPKFGDLIGNWGPGNWGGPFFGADDGSGGGYSPPDPVHSPALALGPQNAPLALKKYLGVRPMCIAAGDSATIQAVPQELFKVVRLIIPAGIASAISVTDLKAGIQPLLASADGEIPGEAFLPSAEDVTFNGYTVLPNQPIFLTVTNTSTQAVTFRAAFLGWVAAGGLMHLYGPNLSVGRF